MVNMLRCITVLYRLLNMLIIAPGSYDRGRSLCFAFDISIFFSFFRRLISKVARSIATKLRHMFSGDPDNKIRQTFGVSSAKKFRGPITSKFWRFRCLIANISEMQMQLDYIHSPVHSCITQPPCVAPSGDSARVIA